MVTDLVRKQSIKEDCLTQLPVQIFEFIDFEPSANLAARAKEKLSCLFGDSPSDSSARATLRKTRGGFAGSLKIRSAVGSFISDVAGSDPFDVVEKLAGEIDGQLRAWKKRRNFNFLSP